MSRLPIRLRLTLVFALAMALVLAAFGAFVYVRLGASLTEALDDSLEARADAVAALVREGKLGPLPADEDGFAQVLGPGGEVLAATPGLSGGSLLGSAPDEVRLLSMPVGEVTVVAGASTEDVAEALDGLLAQLLVGGPVALLLASAAGYVLAGAALRPVEAMRRRAEEISADTAGRRLPLPGARDEVRRLGETLNAMLGRLDAGIERERRFVADASHELRTPLALLQTELELALRRPRPPDELEAALRSAAEEADRLVRLAEDLLVLASSEEGRVPLRPAPVRIPDLLETVARRFAGRAGGADRRIEVGAAPERELRADRLRLEQALGNVVDNALRHGAGTIRLDAAAEDGAVALRVSDEGAGFPPAFLARAFERFSRADDARAHGGAGLGLALVEAVARAHGGEARAANRPGGGAEVTIVLPA